MSMIQKYVEWLNEQDDDPGAYGPRTKQHVKVDIDHTATTQGKKQSAIANAKRDYGVSLRFKNDARQAHDGGAEASGSHGDVFAFLRNHYGDESDKNIRAMHPELPK